jgi:hypothetical protein
LLPKNGDFLMLHFINSTSNAPPKLTKNPMLLNNSVFDIPNLIVGYYRNNFSIGIVIFLILEPKKTTKPYIYGTIIFIL